MKKELFEDESESETQLAPPDNAKLIALADIELTTRLAYIKSECRKAIELGEKATAGPWDIIGGSMTNGIQARNAGWDRVVGCDIDKFPYEKRESGVTRGGIWKMRDASFIAFSRTFTPPAAQALLTAVEGLEAMRNTAKAFSSDETFDDVITSLLHSIATSFPEP